MWINKITRNNVGTPGTEEFVPGAVNIITGPNGAGKSLWLKTIRACLTIPDRGKDYTGLLADDTSFGNATIISADVTITRELSPASSPLTVKGRGIGELKGPKANNYVNEMFDAVSINAEGFLIEDKKERVRQILEAIPFELDTDGLIAIVGNTTIPTGHPLEIIDAVRKTFYDNRTEINRNAKEKRAAAERLSQTISSEVDIRELDAQIASMEENLALLQQERDEGVERSTIAAQKRIDDAINEANKITSVKRAEIQTKIDALRAELREFERGTDAILAAIKLSAQEETDNFRSEADAILSDSASSARLAVQDARNKRDKEVTAEAQRTIVQEDLRAAAELELQARDLTSTLEKIDEFKGNMLTKLPIPGIELLDGEIRIDGKGWDQVPDSRRAILAIDLGIARSSSSGILIVDCMERLDDHQFEIVVEHMRKCGRQCFVGRASVGTPDDPITELRIRTLEAIP